jgi:hypothetical protein
VTFIIFEGDRRSDAWKIREESPYEYNRQVVEHHFPIAGVDGGHCNYRLANPRLLYILPVE